MMLHSAETQTQDCDLNKDHLCVCVCVTGGWRHLNRGERAGGNGWRGIGGMVSNTWFPAV
jgi:hypothetical protein